MPRRWLPGLAAVAAVVMASKTGLSSAAPESSTARPAARSGDLVSLGRTLEISGAVSGTVVSAFGRLRLTGHVSGDVVLLGGDGVVSGQAARIDGDLLVVGGHLDFRDGASESSVGGRVRTVEAMEAAFLSELKTSPVEVRSVSPLLLSLRLLILLAWLLAGLLVLRLAPRRLARAAAAARGRLAFLAAAGATAVLSGALISTFLLATLPARPALALVGVVLAALAAAKLFGLVSLFLLIGRRITAAAPRKSAFFGDPAALTAGLVVLGGVSLAPVAGSLLWIAASLAGIGLALLVLVGGEEEVSAA